MELSSGTSETEVPKLKATEVDDTIVNILFFPRNINVSGIKYFFDLFVKDKKYLEDPKCMGSIVLTRICKIASLANNN